MKTVEGGGDAQAEAGVSATVVNPRFAKPFDRELILSDAQRGMPMVTVEEHAAMGGFGSAVSELLTDEQPYGTPLHRIAVPDELVEPGSRMQMRKHYGLDPEGIEKRTREWLESLALSRPSRLEVETAAKSPVQERVLEHSEAASRN